MAEQKEVKKKENKETSKTEVNQSVGKALLLGLGLIALGAFVIRGAIGDFLNFLGIVFLIVGIAQFFQNRKAKRKQ